MLLETLIGYAPQPPPQPVAELGFNHHHQHIQNRVVIECPILLIDDKTVWFFRELRNEKQTKNFRNMLFFGVCQN